MATRKITLTTAMAWVTCAVCILSLTASIAGLVIDGIYRDSEVIKTAWFANDSVTLFVVGFLVVSVWIHRQGNLKGLLLWLGLMAYMFYNYAFYLFGARFNVHFLLYAALFSLSLYAIIIGLLAFNASGPTPFALPKTTRIVISIFLGLIAVPLLVVEVSECISFIGRGTEPRIPVLILSLDLSMIVPTTLVAAVLFWRGNPWGNVLAVMMLVKAACYGIVLVSATLLIDAAALAAPDRLLPFYIFLVTGGLSLTFIFFIQFKPVSVKAQHRSKP